MADMICKKGFLLTPEEESGDYVPFFIQVRNKDIIWDDELLPIDLRDIVAHGENIESFDVLHCWKFTYNNWYVTLYEDGRYTASRSMLLQLELPTNTFSNGPTNKLEYNIKLPFTTKCKYNSDGFNVNLTMSGKSNIVMSSTYGVVHKTSSDETINSIGIYIMNPSIPFTNDIVMDSEFTDTMYITVNGQINR